MTTTNLKSNIRTIVPKAGAKRRPLKGLNGKRRTPASGADPRAIGSLFPPSREVPQDDGNVIYEYYTPRGYDAIYMGGEVIGSAPLKVIFWGHGWTLNTTSPTIYEVQSAVNAIVASPYLNELKQYGFNQIDSIEFSKVLSDPPSPTYTDGDVGDLVWGLIDAGAYPEPDDDGGQNIYMVFVHPGTNYTTDDPAAGGHGDPWDFDLPADTDYAWVGWVDSAPSIDGITSVFAHELVEMITDPIPGSLFSGWISNQPKPLNEISDICYPTNGPAGGYAVAAYYSKQLGCCVVPSLGLPRYINLTETDHQVGTPSVARGQTVSDGRSDCLQGTYQWTLFIQPRQAVITADLSSYAQPEVTWTVNGQQIIGAVTLHKIPVDSSYDPLSAIKVMPQETADIAVDLQSDTELIITCPADTGQVRLAVTCTAQESDNYNGYKTDSTQTIYVYLTGRTRFLDSRFRKDQLACLIKHLARVEEVVGIYIDKGDPIPPWVERSLANVDAELQGLDVSVERLADGLSAAIRSKPRFQRP